MAYRKRYCDDCGLEAPQNELQSWTDQVEVARESDTVQTFATGAVGRRTGKVKYRTDHLLICSDCHDKRLADLERLRLEELARLAREAEARANRRRWTLISGAVVGLIGIGLVWALVHAANSGQATAASADSDAPAQLSDSGTASTPALQRTDATASADPSQTASLSQADLQTSTSAISPVPPAPVASVEPSLEPTGSAPDGQTTTAPLKPAISAALSSGDETPWTQGSNSGTVSVGPQVQWRGRTCRTYGYTTNGVKSAVTTVCQVAGQGWQRVVQ